MTLKIMTGGDHAPVSWSPFVSCFRAGGRYRYGLRAQGFRVGGLRGPRLRGFGFRVSPRVVEFTVMSTLWSPKP